MRGSLRLTEVLARLHVFSSVPPPVLALPAAPGERAVSTTPAAPGEPVTAAAPGGLGTPGTAARPAALGKPVTAAAAWREPAERRARGVAPTGSTDDRAFPGFADLSAASQASILDPLGLRRPDPPVGRPAAVALPFLSDGTAPWTAAPARQIDETTCGSAVLSMLALAGDASLALQVARDPGARFAALQRRVHLASSRAGLVSWPRRFGTAPWAAAAVARYGRVRYTHRVVGGPRGVRVLRQAVRAALVGVPVPLFTGGDVSGGWQAAVPRHVVLLVAGDDAAAAGGETVRLYEPSSATLHTVPTAVLLAPDKATPPDRAALTAALGYWPHVVWAVLPRP